MKTRFFFLFFLIFGSLQVSVSLADDSASIASGVAEAISKTCWSCEIYGKVAGGLNGLFTTMFRYFTQESPYFIGFVLGVFALVLVFKMFKIVTFPGGDYQLAREWDSVFRYLARIGVVFLFFFSSQALNLAMTPSNNDRISPVRDMFIDGPLALGTSLGCSVGRYASQGAASANLSGIDFSCDTTDSNSYLDAHITSAKSILRAFHEMGAGGIALGVSIVTQSGSIMQSSYVVGIISAIAGFALSMLFAGFTISFGLRYVDALLRAMVSLSLFPIFLILWVFDTTRSIAFSAFRNVLFMAVLFAVSGFLFVLAMSVMNVGCETVIKQACNASELAGAAMFDTSSSSQTPTFNYVSYLFLVGCCGVAIGIASSAFKIAQELTLGSEGEIGIGTATGDKMSGMASKAAGGGITRAFGLFGK